MPYKATRTKEGVWTVIYTAGPGAFAEIERCAKRREARELAEAYNRADARVNALLADVAAQHLDYLPPTGKSNM